MAFLFRRDREFLARHGFDAVAHVPFLLNGDLSYADEANRFLRERALLDWHPNNRSGEPTAKVRTPAENTIFALARDLENFLSYVDINESDWRSLDYLQILRTYQADQLSGAWSERGEPLAPATINRRVGTVCEFLSWAGDRGLRPSFRVMGSRSTVRDRSGTATANRYRDVVGRAGRVRERVERLRIPTVAEIDAWLGEVEARRGKAKALVCRTILETGMRLEEVALLRADQLPDPDSVLPGYPARMDICYGTKGFRQVGDSEKKGKARTLRFGVTFLHVLDDYRRLRRARALAAFRRTHPSEKLPQVLFLADDGAPLTKKVIYNAWNSLRTVAFPRLEPPCRSTCLCLPAAAPSDPRGKRQDRAVGDDFAALGPDRPSHGPHRNLYPPDAGACQRTDDGPLSGMGRRPFPGGRAPGGMGALSRGRRWLG